MNLFNFFFNSEDSTKVENCEDDRFVNYDQDDAYDASDVLDGLSAKDVKPTPLWSEDDKWEDED